ncbi:MAG: histone deacetylase [Acidobacteriota bacterium]|nr:MAG: histone deacetylase [Acidobacteriota bacterium]
MDWRISTPGGVGRVRGAWRSWLARRGTRFVHAAAYALPVAASAYDPRRGERVLSFLAWNRLVRPEHVLHPEPASMRALRRVHAEGYLGRLDRSKELTATLGYEPTLEMLDRLVVVQRTMVGGTMLALREALSTKRLIVHLGGGLHHARTDRGAGFCLFNDVAVAIASRREAGYRGRILVIDLDMHDGDGTRAIFANDPTVHTFSVHERPWDTTEALEATSVALGPGVDDDTYFSALERQLPAVFSAFRPQLVVFLAGTDPSVNDKRGHWRISDDGLLARDAFVLQLVRDAAGSPRLVITLAGGYGRDAWRPTARFLAWHLSGGRRLEPPATDELTLHHYRLLAEPLDAQRLRGIDKDEGDWTLSEQEVLGEVGAGRRQSRLLDYYSPHGVELALEQLGFLDRIRARGFDTPTLDFELDHPAGQTVRLFGDARRKTLLGELRVRRDKRQLPGHELLSVEWLLLQNPRASFTAERPRLPGQRHPGLGLLHDTASLLLLVCDRLRLDGIVFTPSHYHLAVQSERLLRFLHPDDQARFEALRGALEPLSLEQAARALEQRRVRETDTGHSVRWEPRPMVMPASERLRARMEGEDYENRRRQARAGFRFALHPEPES